MPKRWKGAPKRSELLTDAQKKNDTAFAASFKHNDKKYGLFREDHSYVLADQHKKRRDNHADFMAMVFAMEIITPFLNYDEVGLFLLISDYKFFELKRLYPRTGWKHNRIVRALKGLIGKGYVIRKKPEQEYIIKGDELHRVSNKYYPTQKYDKKYKELVDYFNGLIDSYKQ